ncbi:hypothetical protein UA08_01413 [Talaromyces atroroseus]|uniref:DEUBAD domain-containing protein n=1 Tax=Talaromyces atroroseus TaxID=1441469 RepID=A0A1Q5QC08_TALAT|nr:hypothetical protein UA08_01413 [Talaromyces atroroseus]OKL63487.1 hypothetical protein UA08_01413 [Talaromyces atroroseus]
MPPKRKAVSATTNTQVVDAPQTRSRTRSQQLQTPAEPVRDAAHLETSRAMSSTPKQNAARKRGPWGEDYLMTNPKSALVHADLVRLFSNPKAWEYLEEDEKRELISLLPSHIHPNPDPDPEDPDSKIPPLPESFLRYDNNWRAALRNFQYDLESGRYKPDWQRQARRAVQERAEGKFDDYKEREFEQFWGQKQKINHGLIAGESSKVKLETLIQHDVVRVGDVWKYWRKFGKQTVIEKEVKITAIDGAILSFLVPVGQRVFLCSFNEPEKDPTHEGKHAVTDDSQMNNDISPVSHDDEPAALKTHDQPNQDEPSKGSNDADNSDHAPGPQLDVEAEINKEEIQVKEDESTTDQPMAEILPDDHQHTAKKRGRGRPRKRKTLDEDEVPVNTALEATEASVDAETEPSSCPVENGTSLNPDQDAKGGTQKEPTTSMDVDSPGVDKLTQVETENPQSQKTLPLSPTSLEIEVHNIAGPNALTKKILEIDGRIKNPPNGNAWKEFRCYRNNQDMGSLWEVRQAWYVKFQQE